MKKYSCILSILFICTICHGYYSKPVYSHAFLAVYEFKFVRSEGLLKVLKNYLPEKSTITDLHTDIQANKGMYSFKIDNMECEVAFLPQVIPWSEFEEVISHSRWKKAKQALRKHKAQIVVRVTGYDKDRIGQKLLLTRIISACAETHNSAAILWPDSMMIHPPALFIKMTKKASPKRIPYMLWFNFLIRHNQKNTLDVFSFGLNAFGFRELEIIKSERSTTELSNIILEATNYLMDGNKIKDGSTIVTTTGIPMIAVYSDSSWARIQKVIYLMEREKKPETKEQK